MPTQDQQISELKGRYYLIYMLLQATLHHSEFHVVLDPIQFRQSKNTVRATVSLVI